MNRSNSFGFGMNYTSPGMLGGLGQGYVQPSMMRFGGRTVSDILRQNPSRVDDIVEAILQQRRQHERRNRRSFRR